MTEPVVTPEMLNDALDDSHRVMASRMVGLQDEPSFDELQAAAMQAAIIAALKVAPSPWRPIAEAPRDGTEVDLFGYPLEASSQPVRIADAHWHCGDWLVWDNMGNDEPRWRPVWNPTHFQPLPTPPSDEP
jgi:hypothetical protein